MRGQSHTLVLKVGQPLSRVFSFRSFPPDGTPGVIIRRSCGASPHDSVDFGIASLRESSVAADAARISRMFHPLDVKICACCWLIGYGRRSHPCAEYAYSSSLSQSWTRHGDGALRSRRGQLRRKDGRQQRLLAAHLCESWCPSPRHRVGARCGPGRRGGGRADADGFFRPRPGSRSVEARPLRRSRHSNNPTAEITAQLAQIASWKGLFIAPIPGPRIVVPAPAETERISFESPHKERKP